MSVSTTVVSTRISATRCNLTLQCDLHYPLMQLFDHLRPQLSRQVPHRPVIRDLFSADPGKLAIDQIGAHLSVSVLRNSNRGHASTATF